jgi:DNA-binding HxlR family transcriptional regulator
MEKENLRKFSYLRRKGAFEILLFLHERKMRYTDIDMEFVHRYREKLAGQTLTCNLEGLRHAKLIEKDQNDMYFLTEKGKRFVKCLLDILMKE